MVVVTSRQTGARPETIRTRLARFMPKGPATGWSIVWSAQVERPEEVTNEDELRAAEHLGCYGAAVAHALAQAEIAALRLRVTAEAPAATPDGAPQPITVEIRAQIPGPPLDQMILESLARRVEVSCPVWKSLAAEVGVKVTAILDDPATTDTAQPQTDSAAPPTREPAPARAHAPISMGKPKLLRPAMPRWLTPRMAVLLAIAAAGAFAMGPLHWAMV
jgi:organic hydroperoxide reductase OsmC/OhrA